MLRPKVVLWWGIGLTIASTVLNLVAPAVFYGAWSGGSGATGVDQGLAVTVQTILQVVTGSLPVLGPALIAASIVMAYVDRLAVRSPQHTFRLGQDEAPRDASR